MIARAVTPGQRHNRAHPCLICGGYKDMPPGKGIRCAGFRSDDGEWEHCQREQYAGRLELDERTTPPTYAHKLRGECRCGVTHGPAPFQPAARRLAPVTTRYDLRDESGRIVGTHMRKDYLDAQGVPYRPKEMWWERLQGRSSLTMPLYGLLDHLKAPADALHVVCEGEKAAKALADALKRAERTDVVALATVTGAPACPCDDSLRPLVGFTVALWADNDDDGKRHMEYIAERLQAMGAPAPKRITWKDAPAKGDAADYLARGGTVEGLLELVQERSDKQSPEQPKMPDPPKMPKDALIENVGTLANKGHLRMVSLADVQPERVQWLDKGYVPLGKITGIIGDPGLGKSTLTLHYVACHTRGWAMPGGTQNAPARAVLMSAEDGLADTIAPRLKAAGAELSRVTALTCAEITHEDGETEQRPIFIPRDIQRIRAVIEETGATLLVIDPLTAYLDPDVNSHRDQDVRTALAPLARMADETGCAVMLVRHLNKSAGGNTLYRGGGSIGITGAERAELVVAADPDDEDRRVVAVHKHNLHKPVPALAFEILDTQDEIPYVHWLGTSDHTAAQLLAVPADEEARTETDEAVGWLRDLLANKGGQIVASEGQEAARKQGISPKVLRSARMRICEKPTKEGFGEEGKWIWRLSATKMPDPPKMPKDAHISEQGTLDGRGHLSEGPLCEVTGGAHVYAMRRTADGRRVCIECDEPEGAKEAS